MDPLSISVSIIAILQASNAVLSICYDYRAAVKGSSWALTRVTEEVKALRTVVEALENLTADALVTSEEDNTNKTIVSRLPTLDLLCKSNGDKGALLDLCLKELKGIERKLTPPGWAGAAGSKRLAAVRALGWPFQENDLTKRLETIGRFRDTLNLAITADQTTLILKIDEVVQAIQDKTLGVQDELGRLIQSINRVKIDDHRQKIHDWLAAPDPSSNHVHALGKRQATTGSWFIGGGKFAHWKTKPNSFLWLHGIPGCGKTILSSTIIEEVRTYCELNLDLGVAPNPPPTWALAYFYFDFSSQGKKQNQDTMIRSLIKQLSEQLPYTSEALESIFSSCTNGNRTPTTKALRTCLGQLIGEFNHVFVILDALDECADQDELMDSLQEIVTRDLQMLHVLATSRKEKEIEDGFEPILTEDQKVYIQSNLINEDIRAYIYARLQTDKKLKRWQKDEYSRMIEMTLMEKADGMFRWAACQLDALRKCIQLRQLRLALASLPETLYDTYANILCDIDQDNTKDALKILQWLAYSARPLRIEEVADVIAVNIKNRPRIDPDSILPEPRDILTICSSLITTNEDGNWKSFEKSVGEQIKLAHLSVRDYLTSKEILAGKAAQYSIQETHAQEVIAEICLAYLLQFDKADSLAGLTANQYPLALYAAEYWAHHVRASRNETDQIVLLIMELFSNQNTFSNWLQLFDPDKESVEAGDWVLPDVAEPLYYASQAGLVEPVRILIRDGAGVNAGGKLYGRALQAASAGGYYQTVKLLVDKGAYVNEQIGTHDTALQVASAEGHNEVVKTLLEGGAEVNLQGGLYGNSLQGASAAGHDDIVRTLINAKANVNAEGGQYGTALLAASFGGFDKVVKSLLNAGADIQLPDERGRTALQQAAAQGHKSTVLLLINEGADVNAEDYDGWAPLDEAAPAGFRDIVQVLLDAGSKVVAPDENGSTALHFTASQGHTAIVQLLLQNGADANFCDKEKWSSTPLTAAASAGWDETVKALIDGGAFVNAVEHYGWTPLHAAIVIENLATVRVLLENGAKLTADMEGWTPLHIAVLKGNKSIVELLLANGAEIDAQDASGKTPIEWAALSEAERGNLESRVQRRDHSSLAWTGLRVEAGRGENLTVRQLLKNGADINARDAGGMTALMYAAFMGHPSTMILLIENGADVNLMNDKKQTIMDYFDRWEDEAIIKLLEGRFDYKAREDEKKLKAQRRQDVLQLLKDWRTRGNEAIILNSC